MRRDKNKKKFCLKSAKIRIATKTKMRENYKTFFVFHNSEYEDYGMCAYVRKF